MTVDFKINTIRYPCYADATTDETSPCVVIVMRAAISLRSFEPHSARK